MNHFTSGSGPFAVYFEFAGTSYLLKRQTLAAAKTEALTQARLKRVYVSVQSKGLEVFTAKPGI